MATEEDWVGIAEVADHLRMIRNTACRGGLTQRDCCPPHRSAAVTQVVGKGQVGESSEEPVGVALWVAVWPVFGNPSEIRMISVCNSNSCFRPFRRQTTTF